MAINQAPVIGQQNITTAKDVTAAILDMSELQRRKAADAWTKDYQRAVLNEQKRQENAKNFFTMVQGITNGDADALKEFAARDPEFLVNGLSSSLNMPINDAMKLVNSLGTAEKSQIGQMMDALGVMLMGGAGQSSTVETEQRIPIQSEQTGQPAANPYQTIPGATSPQPPVQPVQSPVQPYQLVGQSSGHVGERAAASAQMAGRTAGNIVPGSRADIINQNQSKLGMSEWSGMIRIKEEFIERKAYARSKLGKGAAINASMSKVKEIQDNKIVEMIDKYEKEQEQLYETITTLSTEKMSSFESRRRIEKTLKQIRDTGQLSVNLQKQLMKEGGLEYYTEKFSNMLKAVGGDVNLLMRTVIPELNQVEQTELNRQQFEWTKMIQEDVTTREWIKLEKQAMTAGMDTEKYVELVLKTSKAYQDAEANIRAHVKEYYDGNYDAFMKAKNKGKDLAGQGLWNTAEKISAIALDLEKAPRKFLKQLITRGRNMEVERLIYPGIQNTGGGGGINQPGITQSQQRMQAEIEARYGLR